jgi:hypothetical protein
MKFEWWKAGNGNDLGGLDSGWLKEPTRSINNGGSGGNNKAVIWGTGIAAGLLGAGAVAWNYWNEILLGLEVGGISGAIAGAAYAGFKIKNELIAEEMVMLHLKPKQGMKANPERFARMTRDFRQLYAKYFWKKRLWVKWQIIRNERKKYEFRMIIPKAKKGVIMKYLGTCYPDVIIKETPVVVPSFFEPETGEATHLKLESNDQTLGIRSDLDNQMGDILGMMDPKTILEITFSPASAKPIRDKGRKKVKELEQAEEKGSAVRAEIEQVKQRYQNNPNGFDVFIDAWAYSGLEAFVGRISARTERSNKINGYPYESFASKRNPIAYDMKKRVLARWQSNLLTDRELANFLMLPPKGHPIWEHIECELPKPPITDKDFVEGLGIGYIDSDDPKQDGRIARLKVKTLCNHGLIAGKSGGGKGSSLSMFMKMDFLQQWIEGKPDSMGATICDPHGSSIFLILSYLLDMEAKGYKIPWYRVKCVSFGALGAYQYPVAMNPLHMFDYDKIDAVATDTEKVILSAFDSEHLSKGASDLQRAIQVLLGSKRDHSILDITRLFEYNDTLRNELVRENAVKNPVVNTWLEKIDDKIEDTEKDMTIGSIDTRLASLTTKQSIQRLFCRKGNYFDVESILQNGDLVLVDFLLAEPECFKLVASWLSRKYYSESQRRGYGKRPHLLIFDEVQKFNVPITFNEIISENRKFNMGLVLMTQKISNLDDTLADTIMENAGFVLSVRVEQGADKMARILKHPFTAEELENLENGLEAAVKSNDGRARLKLEYPQFLLEGEPTWKDSDEEEQAIDIARNKFIELLARDHKTAEEADQEVYEFVYGVAPVPEAETTDEPELEVAATRSDQGDDQGAKIEDDAPAPAATPSKKTFVTVVKRKK